MNLNSIKTVLIVSNPTVVTFGPFLWVFFRWMFDSDIKKVIQYCFKLLSIFHIKFFFYSPLFVLELFYYFQKHSWTSKLDTLIVIIRTPNYCYYIYRTCIYTSIFPVTQILNIYLLNSLHTKNFTLTCFWLLLSELAYQNIVLLYKYQILDLY